MTNATVTFDAGVIDDPPPPPDRPVDLVRDVLDEQLVDSRGEPLGKVDGLVLALHPDRPPEVHTIESGLPALARRLPKVVGVPLRALARHTPVRRGTPCRIPWTLVDSVDRDVRVRLDARKSPTTAWEHFLRAHVTRHVPFSGPVDRYDPSARASLNGVARPAASPILVHLESLLGRQVRDPAGASIGRIEEFRAHLTPTACVLDDVLLGKGALLARLSLSDLADSALGLLGAHSPQPTHRVPWPLLDLSDPKRPRLTRAIDDLENYSLAPD